MSSHPSPFATVAKFGYRSIAGAAAVVMAAATATTVIPPRAVHAAGPGLTLFGEQSLNFALESGSRDTFDRYKLRVPVQETAIAQIVVDYNPDRWDGRLDPERIDLRYRKKKRGRDRNIPVKEVNWDSESGIVSVVPEEPVPAGERVEVVLHNVYNPRNGGFFKFKCKIAIPGDRTQLFRYLGNWVIDIE